MTPLIFDVQSETGLMSNMCMVGIVTSLSFWTYVLLFRNCGKTREPVEDSDSGSDTDLKDEQFRELDENEFSKYSEMPFYHFNYAETDLCNECYTEKRIDYLENELKAQNAKIKKLKNAIYKRRGSRVPPQTLFHAY